MSEEETEDETPRFYFLYFAPLFNNKFKRMNSTKTHFKQSHGKASKPGASSTNNSGI